MSNRFVLYYWPIPFRGQFIRYILAHAGLPWHEPDRGEVSALYQSDVANQPVPFMGPPVLHDTSNEVWLSQMPAICHYLGQTLDLMPGTPALDAMTLKVLGDCNDVINSMTRNCGAAMWTPETWSDYAGDRLCNWLEIFETLGRRNGLTETTGTLLGTNETGVSDLACAALWVTIADKLPALEGLLHRHAPNVMALSNRLAATPAIATLRSDQTAAWGDVWCEGQIEASLRTVLETWSDDSSV